MNKKSSYTFEWTLCAVGIVFICLIVALYGTFAKVSDLSHENELLVAQKETLHEVMIDMPQCDNGRFKYDPITGSIYDNETKEIYRKVETIIVDVPKEWLEGESDKPVILEPTIELDYGGNDER